MSEFIGENRLSEIFTLIKNHFVAKSQVATSSTTGLVKPDGTTTTVDANGVLSASGGSEYTAGTGIDIDNNEISVETMSASDLQEVKDAFAPNIGAPARMLNYSTDEQVVGTWIDGKPLYQKTLSGQLPNATDTTEIFHGISNFKMLISVTATAYNPATGEKLLLPFVGDSYESEYTKQTLVTVSNSGVYLRNYGVDRSAATAYITLCYTKTTD